MGCCVVYGSKSSAQKKVILVTVFFTILAFFAHKQ
jgi:hypothetical protein